MKKNPNTRWKGNELQQTIWDEIKMKKYLRRTKNYSKPNRNIIKEINTWPVNLVWYSGPFLKWTRELQQIDKRTRKLMTMYKVLHSRDNEERSYASRKREEKDLPVLKIALMQRYDDTKTTWKSVEEHWLRQPEAILTTRGSTEQRWLENKNSKKNDSILDILSD